MSKAAPPCSRSPQPVLAPFLPPVDPQAPATEDTETGPGLGTTLGLMALGAGGASLWWGAVLLYLLFASD